jgi:hypothetical protein
VELEKIEYAGVYDTYALSCVRKEFMKAVNEPWKDESPFERYQKKLIGDLAVLCEYKEQAIIFSQFEKLEGEQEIFCIRHPKTPKNIRILYTIQENSIILLGAFLEKNDSDYNNAIKKARKRLKILKE